MTPEENVRPQDWVDGGAAARLDPAQRRLAADLLRLAADAHPPADFVAGLGRELAGPTRRASPRALLRPAWGWGLRLAGIALLLGLVAAAIELIPHRQGAPVARPAPEITPSPRPTVAPTPIPGILVPPDAQACRTLQAALEGGLGLAFDLTPDTVLTDMSLQNLEVNGRGCGLVATAPGGAFTDPASTFAQVQGLLRAQGYPRLVSWGQDDNRIFFSQYGGRRFAQLAGGELQVWLDLSWQPLAGVTCPTPDAAEPCRLQPEQGRWRLRVTIGKDPISPVVTRFVDLWLANDPAVAGITHADGGAQGLITETFRFDLGTDPIAALDRLMRVTDHARLTYSLSFDQDSYTGESVIAYLYLSQRAPGNNFSLPEVALRLVKDAGGAWRIAGIMPPGAVPPLSPTLTPTPIPGLPAPSPGWAWVPGIAYGLALPYPQDWQAVESIHASPPEPPLPVGKAYPRNLQRRVELVSPDGPRVIWDTWEVAGFTDLDLLEWICAQPERLLPIAEYNARIQGLPAIYWRNPDPGPQGQIAVVVVQNGDFVHRIALMAYGEQRQEDLETFRTMLAQALLPGQAPGETRLPD